MKQTYAILFISLGLTACYSNLPPPEALLDEVEELSGNQDSKKENNIPMAGNTLLDEPVAGNSPNEVSIAAPSELFVNQTNVTDSFTFSGNCSFLEKPVIVGNENFSIRGEAICENGKWSLTISFSEKPDGEYVLKAYHEKDNVRLESKIVRVIKDTGVPLLTIESPLMDAPKTDLGALEKVESPKIASALLNVSEEAFYSQVGSCQNYGRYIVLNRSISERMGTHASTSSSALFQAQSDFENAQNRLSNLNIANHMEDSETSLDYWVVENISEQRAKDFFMTGDYKQVSRDCLLAPEAMPNDAKFPLQYHLSKLEAPKAWDLNVGSSEVVVAVLDTGVDIAHEDFQRNGKSIVLPGANFGTCPCSDEDKMNGFCTVDGDTVTYLGTIKCKDVKDFTPIDLSNTSFAAKNHGTMVAGSAAAVGHNKVGVSGVGLNLKVLPVRVSDMTTGGAFTSDLDNAIKWAADNGAKVINCSYSGVYRPTAQLMGEYARAKGALYVNSAGNSTRNIKDDCLRDDEEVPNDADCDKTDHKDVIVVSATDKNDGLAFFSSFGDAVDVAAPGVGIITTMVGNKYTDDPILGGRGVSGTSFSSPIVAGVLAMIFSVNPKLTSNEVEDILFRSADKLPNLTEQQMGHGRVNLFRAVLLAQNPQGHIVHAENQEAFVLNGACSEKGSVDSVKIEGFPATDCSPEGKWSTLVNLKNSAEGYFEFKISHRDGAGNEAKQIRRVFKTTASFLKK